MKVLLMAAGFALLSVNSAFACMGGRLDLEEGYTLTSEGITGPGVEISARSMENLEPSFSFMTKSMGRIAIRIMEINSDAGGIIDTYYVISRTGGGSEKSIQTIKIESNYRGNGVRARGLQMEPDFDVDQVYGC